VGIREYFCIKSCVHAIPLYWGGVANLVFLEDVS